MELTPPPQRQKRTVTKNNKNIKAPKSKYGNIEKEINYIKSKTSEKYHPPVDAIREKMLGELNCDLNANNNNNDNTSNNKVELPQNHVRAINRASITPNASINPQISSPSINGALANPSNSENVKRISYTGLSILRRKKKLTDDEYLDAKAIKAGFKDQYERVLTRYSETLRLYKSHIFGNAREKAKVLRKLHGMERYLKEAERLKSGRIKSSSVYIKKGGDSLTDNYVSCQMEAMESRL
jgi:hypothetical protein